MTTPQDRPADASELIAFWKAAGPARWFAKDAEFDRELRERFLPSHERAARGELEAWLEQPHAALALVLLLDQFPRNSFRDSPRMYATDELARHAARRAIQRGHDRAVEPELRLFFYLPYQHSESLLDQMRGVELFGDLAPELMVHAVTHRDVVERFGRFPHRNAILGRPSSEAELAFLAAGGFGG